MLCSRRLIGGVWPHAILLLALSSCSGTDIGYPRLSDTTACPEPLTPTANAGAGTSGGLSSGHGGSPPSSSSGGTINSAGGAGSAEGGSTSAGAPTTTAFMWPTAYDAGMSPMPADGHHNAGSGCMLSVCHGSKVPFLFGGTVYKADGATGAPNVQVGISDGSQTVTAYSATNGNIWVPSSAAAIDFASARIAIRTAAGERVKPASAGRGPACNGSGCHGASQRLVVP